MAFDLLTCPKGHRVSVPVARTGVVFCPYCQAGIAVQGKQHPAPPREHAGHFPQPNFDHAK